MKTSVITFNKTLLTEKNSTTKNAISSEISRHLSGYLNLMNGLMKYLLWLLLGVLPHLGHAQQQVKGYIFDSSGHPLDAATVTLSQANKNVTYALADSGKFILTYPSNGNYTLTATLVGYITYSRTIELPKDTIKIFMQEDSRQLNQVVITASRPVIERKIDRIVFNVESSIASSGGTAWDALKKSPGVQAGSDGSISANRKGVTVYVDDKPVHLSGDDLTSYLQGLPSDAVSRIEVITNPPAKYDAEGGAIINIVTKKSKSQGFNISLNGGYTQATFGSYNGSALFNYRKNKLNLYGSYGYNNRYKKYTENDYVNYETPNNSSFWNSDKTTISRSEVNDYKLGADYQLNDRQVIGFVFTGNNRVGNSHSSTNTVITDNNNRMTDSLLQTATRSNGKSDRYTFNLNYSAKLDTNGRSINIDLDYLPFQSRNSQYLDNNSFFPDGSQASNPYRIYTPTSQKINIYAGKVDYEYKIGKIWSLTSGVKYSSIKTENVFDFYNNTGSVPVLDPVRSDHFDYTENTAAAYTSISGSTGKWTFNGGLRGEFTNSNGLSQTLDSLTKRRYFKLFPTAYVVYQLSELDELQLTYSYRINRPEYFRLNPFKSYVTPYSFVTGNPQLQPSFIQSIELGYTYQKLYNITGYYHITHDLFTYITEQDNANNLLYTTQQNLGLSSAVGMRFSLPIHPTNWWEINADLDFGYQTEKSVYLQGNYNYHKATFTGNLSQTFTINKKGGLKAELSTEYNSPQIAGIFSIARTYDVSAGIKRTILDGQGTIKLAAGDIFYGNPFRVASHYLTQNNGLYMKQDTRSLSISLTYKLGKTIRDARNRNTSSEEEKKRVQ